MTGLAAGKVALVTGAGSGIGRATAELFAAEGAAMVVASDINGATAAETAALIEKAGFTAIGALLDVTDRSAVFELCDRTVERVRVARRCSELRRCAGPAGPMKDCDEEAWRQVMAVNLDGIFFCLQAEIRAMERTGGGAIVNIASGAVVDPHSGLSPYGASKAAVVHLTRTAALESAADGIRLNVILPAGPSPPCSRSTTTSPQAPRRRRWPRRPSAGSGSPPRPRTPSFGSALTGRPMSTA